MPSFDDSRNPLIIPDRSAPNRPSCPVCGHTEFLGRRVMGVITFTCRKAGCGAKWQGGLPQEPQDPRIPLPTESYVPPVRFGKDVSNQDIELRRRVDLRADFLKGAPVPREGDE